MPKKHEILDWLFARTLGKFAYYRTFSPNIEILGNSEHLIREILRQELAATGRKLTLLDIGARDAVKSKLAVGYDYKGIDIAPKSSTVLQGDICNCPEIPDNSYDVTFSLDVFEHVERPWIAAEECLRLTKPGGLLIHRTLFAYRYHPSPSDYWRFTSQGLEHLFTHTGLASTIVKGYDIRGRRRDRRGSSLVSKPPIDWLGGFRENWQVLWIGRKA